LPWSKIAVPLANDSQTIRAICHKQKRRRRSIVPIEAPAEVAQGCGYITDPSQRSNRLHPARACHDRSKQYDLFSLSTPDECGRSAARGRSQSLEPNKEKHHLRVAGGHSIRRERKAAAGAVGGWRIFPVTLLTRLRSQAYIRTLRRAAASA